VIKAKWGPGYILLFLAQKEPKIFKKGMHFLKNGCFYKEKVFTFYAVLLMQGFLETKWGSWVHAQSTP